MRERTEFGQRLYEAMTYAKLSQPELSKASGVAQGTIGELVWKGRGSMAVVRLANACGVRPEWLAEGKGPMVGTVSEEIAEAAAALQALPDRWREWALRHVWDTIETAQESVELEKNGLHEQTAPASVASHTTSANKKAA